MKKLILFTLIITVSFPLLSFKVNGTSKIKSVNIQFEGFDTESVFRIDCDRFDGAFRETKKTKLLTGGKDLREVSGLLQCFAKEKNKELDVRGKITINYSGYRATYCFDTFGFFTKDGIVYYNKDLLKFISDKVYGNHPEELN